jgi:hypothetical protein
MLILHHPKLPGCSSMRVVCRTRSSVGLKIALLLELGKHLPHSIYPKGLRGRAPEHGLSSRRHRHPKHSKLHTDLSMVGGSKLHSLMQGARCGVLTMVKHNSDPLIYRRVSSSTRASHYPLASPHHRSASVALSVKLMSFASDKDGDLSSYLTSLPVSRSQHAGALPGPPLSPGGSGLRHNDSHLCPGHLLPKLGHIICVSD